MAQWLLSRLPRRWLGTLGAWLGLIAQALGVRRQVVERNLALAFPALTPAARRAIAVDNYRHVGRSVLEAFAGVRLSPSALQSTVEYQNFELLEDLLRAGQGVVVASAHLGSWELLAAVGARLGLPVHLVTRRLRGRSNAALQRARARSGLVEIAPAGALREGGRVLRRGQIVVNLLDQNMLRKRGVFVRFFGEWACTTPAASLMAMRCQAPVIVVLAVTQPNGATRLCVEGPFPPPATGSIDQRVRAHTQQLVSVIERYVRANPSQWFWLHRRWKTRPLQEPEAIEPTGAEASRDRAADHPTAGASTLAGSDLGATAAVGGPSA